MPNQTGSLVGWEPDYNVVELDVLCDTSNLAGFYQQRLMTREEIAEQASSRAVALAIERGNHKILEVFCRISLPKSKIPSKDNIMLEHFSAILESASRHGYGNLLSCIFAYVKLELTTTVSLKASELQAMQHRPCAAETSRVEKIEYGGSTSYTSRKAPKQWSVKTILRMKTSFTTH